MRGKERRARRHGHGCGRGRVRGLRVAVVAGSVVLLLGAGTGLEGGGAGVARAGEAGGAGRASVPPAGQLVVPRIDPGKSRRAAVDYLVSRGVPAAEAGARIGRQPGQVRSALALRRRTPQGVRSAWIGEGGKLMAAVVTEEGRRAALAAGATLVAASTAGAGVDLQAVRDKLATEAKENPPPGFNGASFAVDPVAGTVIAHYLFTSHPRVPVAVRQFGDLVTASADVGGVEPDEDVGVAGATMQSTRGNVCTAAWAVDIEDPNGGTPGNGVMTAGHCFDGGSDPASTALEIDTVAAGNSQATGDSSVLGKAGDYGYLRLRRDRGTTTTVNGRVVEAVGEPVVGATVCMYGATTHESCGQIGLLDVTILTAVHGVNYLVEGQVLTDLCIAPGDSGGLVYMDYDQAREARGIAALGIVSTGGPIPGGGHCGMNFTPLSGVDNQGKYHVRIAGG